MYREVGGECNNKYHQAIDKERNNFGKICERREHNKKDERRSSIRKRVRTRRRSEGENTPRFLLSNTQRK